MQFSVSLIVNISATASLAQMETQIQKAGHQWMRQALTQAIRRWEKQPRGCPRCGSSRQRLEGTICRVLQTQFGRVKLAVYRVRCQECLHRWCPARSLLMYLKQRSVTPGLREVAALAGASWPYRHAARLLHRLTGAQIGAEQLRRLSMEQGQERVQQQKRETQQAETTLTTAREAGPPTHVVGLDGGWVASRENRGGMEGKVGVIATEKQMHCFASRPDPATLTWYELAKRRQQGHRLDQPAARARWQQRRYVATFESSYVLGRLAAEAGRVLGVEAASSVVVADGAEWIKRETARHFEGARCILDWPHLWRVMRKAVDEASRGLDQSRSWQQMQRTQVKTWLWHGQGDQVQALLQMWQKQLPAAKSQALLAAIRYLHSQEGWMGNYEQWKQEGYPVGSGIIERAVALVINRRMKKRGMRWKRSNATFLVALRTALPGGDWELPTLARSFP